MSATAYNGRSSIGVRFGNNLGHVGVAVTVMFKAALLKLLLLENSDPNHAFLSTGLLGNSGDAQFFRRRVQLCNRHIPGNPVANANTVAVNATVRIRKLVSHNFQHWFNLDCSVTRRLPPSTRHH
jgi:hypothetical protein